MSRGVSNKITYKPYSQSEQWLLPPSLDELVAENHFVRIVSRTVDELRIEEVFAKNTKGGGASRYNPVMLLKVLIYCYMTGTYSSRMIARQCRENVNVMWLKYTLIKLISLQLISVYLKYPAAPAEKYPPAQTSCSA